MDRMKKLWPFKSATNFTLTVFGIAVVGLGYTAIAKESRFGNPVIAESIKILSTTERIKETLGYPLTYTGSFSNNYQIKDDEQYFAFDVKGTFGTAKVELICSSLPVHKIVNHTTEEAKIGQIQGEIESIKAKIERLKVQMKAEKNKSKKAELSIEEKQLHSEISNKEVEISRVTEGIKTKAHKYYIPGQQIYHTIMKDKSNNAPLPNHYVLHGIDDLAVELPNRSRISVIPPENSAQNFYKEDIKREIRPADLKERLQEKVDDLSEKELAQYSRQKTQFMYSKYGSYRFFYTVILGIGVATFFTFLFRFRMKGISGSSLAHVAEMKFYGHPEVRKLKSEMGNLKWSKTIGGGMRNNTFDCIVDVDGVPKGRVYMKGSKNEETNEVYYDQFVFEYLSKGKSKKINLLA